MTLTLSTLRPSALMPRRIFSLRALLRRMGSIISWSVVVSAVFIIPRRGLRQKSSIKDTGTLKTPFIKKKSKGGLSLLKGILKTFPAIKKAADFWMSVVPSVFFLHKLAKRAGMSTVSNHHPGVFNGPNRSLILMFEKGRLMI